MTTFICLLISLIISIFLGTLLAVYKFKLAKIDMTFLEFAGRLLKGGGFKNISPDEMLTMQTQGASKLTIIDLRDSNAVKKSPFPNAIASPFDSFLKEVVVDNKYHPKEPIVLVCDTGQMSRVAANILVEDETFTKVYSLKGGVANWTKWKANSTRASHGLKNLAQCCGNLVIPTPN